MMMRNPNIDTSNEAIEAGFRAAFCKLVEETKMLKSYLVFGDENGDIVEVPYHDLDEYLANNGHYTNHS